ncbi:unnamed protein product [Rhizophagus irregularis]|uniref:Uncharacterized protein n=4 Tax=Rhizophagus irregularis TaxID=588596 RepID=A0A2N1N2M5_9GLOM|nr:hypothetical protein RhiirC2_867438 [Rhizophagus irregularis]CAB4392105.1 unnamed protein product [Rhizophagus irregularis]CAB5300440.1 unnamed protein product [Rhizophagus irregularis]
MSSSRPHRRTMSISAGSNDSSENLLSIPNQRIVNNTSNFNNTYNSNQNNYPESQKSGKSFLTSISENSNKSSLQNPPHTPSKHKSFEKQMQADTSSNFELKNILSMLVFFCALVFFLGSLSGLGPPFDDLEYAIKKEPINVEEPINFVQDPDKFSDDEENEIHEVLNPFVENPIEDKIDDDHINAIYNDTIFEDGEVIYEDDELKPQEISTEEHSSDNNTSDVIPELPDETKQQNQEESILEDIKIEPNLTNNVDENEIKNTNFGHSDEILLNNGDIKDQLEETSNKNILESNETEEKSNLIGLPNKLDKKKLRHYKLDASGLSDNNEDIVNYAKYTYQAPNPHFTYEDVIGSLTEEERNETAIIQLIEMNTDESLDSSCGTWQKNYAKLHEDILTGRTEQKYVAYVCEANSNCGNLGDRILGMTSTFLFSLLTNRAFLSDWQAPLPLDAIFDSPNIDWSYDSLDPEPTIKDLQSSEINVIDFDAQQIDNQFLLSNWSTKYPDPFIKFHTNRGMIIRTFDSKYYAQPLKEIGLRPHTAFGCIFDYLFRPSTSTMSFISKYTSLFSLNNIFSVGIQIRIRGDTNALQDYKHFFHCADQLTQTYAVPDHKVIYFLITDSEALRNEAVQKLEHVIISGLPIQSNHSHHDHADDVNNAIIENWILSKTDYRIISPGGYGKLAAFHSKQLHTTVSMDYPVFDKQIPDCTKEDAFVTFSKLSSEWSLG